MQYIDHISERFHQFAVVSSELPDTSCLLLKNIGNRLDRIAILELPNEWMVDQINPRLLFIVVQGSLKGQLKYRAR